MNRSRRWSVFILVLAVPLSSARADEKPVEKWLVDRTVTVTPAVVPVPALKYRLFPLTSDRKEGNAVPLYLRFAHERGDARKKELREKPEAWNKLPLDKLPLAEVKAFLDGYKYNLHQLELGARRKTADWNYTLDAGDPIGILLPDAQEMRMHAPLLILKARLEIAEGHYDAAIHTLETGFAFSQQIGETPFLISGLVGIACASQFADCLLELSERKDAPSLYWALAVLPRPLIDLRRGHEFEMKMLELQFPDLADLDRPRAPEEWDAALKRIRKELERLNPLVGPLGGAKDQLATPGTTSNDSAAKSPDLPAARKYLAEGVKIAPAAINAMSPAEVLLRYLSGLHHEYRDDVFKGAYLPYPQARLLSLEADKRLKSHPDTEAAKLATLFLPAVLKVQGAQVRIDRKLAALRVIEALRLHAAANDGKLPDKLEQVTIVPVPDDPGTGRPFEYQLDGKTATLISRIPGEPLAVTGMRYRVTVRKGE